MKNIGAAPCTAMSLTQWFTRSAPTVWCRFISKAIFSLVPTPSTLETSTGSRYFFLSMANRPPKPPISLKHAAIESLMGQILDALLGAVGALDVHAGIGVGDGAGFSRLLCQRLESRPEGASPQICFAESPLYQKALGS